MRLTLDVLIGLRVGESCIATEYGGRPITKGNHGILGSFARRLSPRRFTQKWFLLVDPDGGEAVVRCIRITRVKDRED